MHPSELASRKVIIIRIMIMLVLSAAFLGLALLPGMPWIAIVLLMFISGYIAVESARAYFTSEKMRKSIKS